MDRKDLSLRASEREVADSSSTTPAMELMIEQKAEDQIDPSSSEGRFRDELDLSRDCCLDHSPECPPAPKIVCRIPPKALLQNIHLSKICMLDEQREYCIDLARLEQILNDDQEDDEEIIDVSTD
eukprot:TRINITY_DN12349_c0_g1_i1.p1 TRINITY_DN12349_c0_g1~~TRINITY_DN12349_c0_g1_i1.p1  ORF type:complete len:125 (-),score=33.89 TRINITY_DN12349_c0_g1_i1:380-754(-)